MNCGWAVLDEHGELVASGVWDLKPRRHEGGGMRYYRLHGLLMELIGIERPEAIFYEEVRRHAGTDAAHIYGGIVGKVAEIGERETIPYAGIPVATAKRCATGKGNADKGMMIRAACCRWPNRDPIDDNEADARFVALAGMKELLP
jgi:Holliday junction resolvasome RuvABC endonuclease subunit